MCSYCYFISLLIGKIDALNESQVDRAPLVTDNGRKVVIWLLCSCKKKRRVVSNGIRWGEHLYDSVEILLFTLRGNIRNFFSLGVPDEVALFDRC